MPSAGSGDLIALDRRAGKQLTEDNFAPIRVLLADGDKHARAELRDSLASARDVAVVGEATSGHEAVALAGETRPDVVLIDAPLPDLGGLEATRRITSRPELPNIEVLILSQDDGDEEIFAALRAGARGVLTRTPDPAELLRALRVVAAGGMQVSPSI